jgi:conjugal transfer pilus assembly protein TraA
MLNKFNLSKRDVLFAVLLIGACGVAMSATTGSEFATLFNRLSDWTTGFLGRALAFAGFLVGIGMGIARSNAMPAVVGIVFALMTSVAPSIINGMLSATV